MTKNITINYQVDLKNKTDEEIKTISYILKEKVKLFVDTEIKKFDKSKKEPKPRKKKEDRKTADIEKYRKEYYRANLEKSKVLCECCGVKVQKYNLPIHNQTKKHLKIN